MSKKKILLALSVIVILLSLGIYIYTYSSVPILMYHSFDEQRIGDYAAVSLETFKQQLQFMKEKGYNLISLSEYCHLLKTKEPLPHKAVVLTIDDGLGDTEPAIELLRQFDFPATIFIIVENIDAQDYLTQETIRWFLDNTKVTIGSHTLTHSYLPPLSPAQIEDEIHLSKQRLEAMFSYPVEAISYPIGGFTQSVLSEVEEAGYLCGCATNRGFSKKLNIFALRRIKITERDLGFRLWAKLSGVYTVFKKVKNPY
jgi:peptidoglycan/xylan/chitin deacetylase (PgdA/CDA1 family)